jgi:predicted phosphodiesterase
MEIVEWGATETLVQDIEGVIVAMVHDSGDKHGRATRMRRRFPEADVVAFGHSHMPLVERSEDLGLLLLNPGSPTDRRRAPVHTVALLEVTDGRSEARIVELD